MDGPVLSDFIEEEGGKTENENLYNGMEKLFHSVDEEVKSRDKIKEDNEGKKRGIR